MTGRLGLGSLPHPGYAPLGRVRLQVKSSRPNGRMPTTTSRSVSKRWPRKSLSNLKPHYLREGMTRRMIKFSKESKRKVRRLTARSTSASAEQAGETAPPGRGRRTGFSSRARGGHRENTLVNYLCEPGNLQPASGQAWP